MADAGFFGTSWDDPRTQATLAAAAGLLGGGTFTESLTRGLLGYQGGINKARDEEIKRRLAEAQMQSLLAEAEQRRAEAAKYRVDFTRQWLQEVNGGPDIDASFSERNLVQPWYKLLSSGKTLFALAS